MTAIINFAIRPLGFSYDKKKENNLPQSAVGSFEVKPPRKTFEASYNRRHFTIGFLAKKDKNMVKKIHPHYPNPYLYQIKLLEDPFIFAIRQTTAFFAHK